MSTTNPSNDSRTTATVVEQPDELPATGSPLPGETTSPFDNHQSSDDPPPDYSRRQDPTAPRLPSYGQTATIEQLLPTEEERLASLRAFAEEQQFTPNDSGERDDHPQKPPKDPLKVFRWVKRKMSGEKGDVWQRLNHERRQKWEAERGTTGEAQGDIVDDGEERRT